MKMMRNAILMWIWACGLVANLFAQGFGGPPMSNADRELAKIFGKGVAFSATAETTIRDRQEREVYGMETAYAVLDGKIRTEMDMTKTKNANLSAEDVAHMRQMGMDRMVNVVVPEKNVVYLIYPTLKAYCEMSTRVATRTDNAKPPKMERVELGKETIDGHPCVKTRVIVTEDNGQKTEAIVWEATDLKNIPIQTQVVSGGETITTRYKNINTSKPAASLFAPPTDYKRCGSMEELMMQAMPRMMREGMEGQ
jgi:hypothetical protein